MNDQLQDLLLPPKASGVGVELWLGGVLFLFICLLALWYWNKYRKSAFFVAQKELSALEKLPVNTSEDSRNIALRLASLLCLGLGVRHLNQYQAEDAVAWDRFQKKLNKACYSPVSEKTSGLLFSEAESWLMRENMNE